LRIDYRLMKGFYYENFKCFVPYWCVDVGTVCSVGCHRTATNKRKSSSGRLAQMQRRPQRQLQTYRPREVLSGGAYNLHKHFRRQGLRKNKPELLWYKLSQRLGHGMFITDRRLYEKRMVMLCCSLDSGAALIGLATILK